MSNRTVLAPTLLTANGGIVSMYNDGTGMTADAAAAGHSIAIPTTSIPASGNADRLILLVLNTNSTGRTITIRASTSDGGLTKQGAGTSSPISPPAFESGKGDLTFAAMNATTGIGIFGPFEVARFIQPDGTISIDYSGATGYIAALLLPRSF